MRRHRFHITYVLSLEAVLIYFGEVLHLPDYFCPLPVDDKSIQSSFAGISLITITVFLIADVIVLV